MSGRELSLRLPPFDCGVLFPSGFCTVTMTAPSQKGDGPWCGRPGGTPESGRGWHSPVQLGVLHQSVGVPVTDEGSACEADEAFGVIFQLPSHLEASVCVCVCVCVCVGGRAGRGTTTQLRGSFSPCSFSPLPPLRRAAPNQLGGRAGSTDGD